MSDLRPFSFAFDWRGGQLVLTEENGFQLSLVVPEGNRHGLLLNLTVNRLSPLKKPGEVVFDSYTRCACTVCVCVCNVFVCVTELEIRDPI